MEEESLSVNIATREGSLSPSEGEMWTFVDTRDTRESSVGSQDDSLDDRSEHGSDGSSIVVISLESSTAEEGDAVGDLDDISNITDFICSANPNDECLDYDATITKSEGLDCTLVEDGDRTPLPDIWQEEQTPYFEDGHVQELTKQDEITIGNVGEESVEMGEVACNAIPIEESIKYEEVHEPCDDTTQESQSNTELGSVESNTVDTTQFLEEIREEEILISNIPATEEIESNQSTFELQLNNQEDEIKAAEASVVAEVAVVPEDIVSNTSGEEPAGNVDHEEVEQYVDEEEVCELLTLESPKDIDAEELATAEEGNEAALLSPAFIERIAVEPRAQPIDDQVADDAFENLHDIYDSESSELSAAEEEEAWEFNANGNVSSSVNSSANNSPQHQPINPVGRFYPAKPDLLEEANRIEEMDQMDYSSLTNQDLPAELNLASISRERHYVHHPNRRLNLALSFVVAFSMAAVIGFGLGHFIGLSDNFPPRPGCNGFYREESRGIHDRYEDWSEADWRLELQRVQAANEELSRALKNQQMMCQSQLHNELVTENWDLKNMVGRIRYGKPVRSFEDRDTINRLETENQELRAQVGKLRYQCRQPESTSSGTPLAQDEPSESEHQSSQEGQSWASPNPAKMTNFWDQFISEHVGRLNITHHLSGSLDQLKNSAANLIGVIESRWQELNNISRQVETNKVTLKMKEALDKTAQKIIEIANDMFNNQNKKTSGTDANASQKSWTDQMDRIKVKLESRWNDLKRKFENHDSSGVLSPFKGTKDGSKQEKREESGGRSMNEDWFLLLGKQREKMRKNQHKTDWLFERAKNREQERYEKKKSASEKFKKDKAKFKRRRDSDRAFQDNQWNYFSS